MTAVERILMYTNLPTEDMITKKSTRKHQLPSNWPSRGRIEFKDVCLTYEGTNSTVLKNISFIIEDKQKVRFSLKAMDRSV